MDDPSLTIKVVTPTTFSRHEGFDLASFDDESSLSSPIVFNTPSHQTYPDFKRRISRHFDISVSQFQLWILLNRQNKTIRPHDCIDRLPQSECLTMEDIWYNLSASQNRLLRLYLDPKTDSAAKPDDKNIMIFLKYFNPTEKKVLGIGSVRVSRASKIIELTPSIRERMHWTPQTPLNLYEEIKPGMIECMKPKLTFAQSEVIGGDIICFEVALSRPEIMDFERRGLRATAIDFYQDLYETVRNSPPRPVQQRPTPRRPQREGVQYLPISEIEDSITCSVCNERMWAPHFLPECGHTFCQLCLESWFGTTRTQHIRNSRSGTPRYTCPHCREQVNNRPVEAFSLKAIVQAVARVQQESVPPGANVRHDPWSTYFPRA